MADPDKGVEMPKMRIPDALYERLRELARTTGAPMTVHRRRALEQYLDNHAPAPRDH